MGLQEKPCGFTVWERLTPDHRPAPNLVLLIQNLSAMGGGGHGVTETPSQLQALQGRVWGCCVLEDQKTGTLTISE